MRTTLGLAAVLLLASGAHALPLSSVDSSQAPVAGQPVSAESFPHPQQALRRREIETSQQALYRRSPTGHGQSGSHSPSHSSDSSMTSWERRLAAQHQESRAKKQGQASASPQSHSVGQAHAHSSAGGQATAHAPGERAQAAAHSPASSSSSSGGLTAWERQIARQHEEERSRRQGHSEAAAHQAGAPHRASAASPRRAGSAETGPASAAAPAAAGTSPRRSAAASSDAASGSKPKKPRRNPHDPLRPFMRQGPFTDEEHAKLPPDLPKSKAQTALHNMRKSEAAQKRKEHLAATQQAADGEGSSKRPRKNPNAALKPFKRTGEFTPEEWARVPSHLSGADASTFMHNARRKDAAAARQAHTAANFDPAKEMERIDNYVFPATMSARARKNAITAAKKRVEQGRPGFGDDYKPDLRRRPRKPKATATTASGESSATQK